MAYKINTKVKLVKVVQ